MTKEFIPYEQALALKELGFDEPCIACYTPVEWLKDKPYHLHGHFINKFKEFFNSKLKQENVSAPLYQQAARYLYIKSNNKINIQLNGSDDTEELNRKIKQGIQDLRNLQNNKSD
jgi:hypothetical protein